MEMKWDKVLFCFVFKSLSTMPSIEQEFSIQELFWHIRCSCSICNNRPFLLWDGDSPRGSNWKSSPCQKICFPGWLRDQITLSGQSFPIWKNQEWEILGEQKKTLESPLDCKDIKPFNTKGNKLWIFIGRTDAEASTLWPSDGKSQLIGEDSDASKDWRQEEKGTTEDDVFGWHHWLNGHEFEQTPGESGGQGSLVCYSPWDHKELDVT